ncbi:axonemal dynein light intermediate polypeptide 1 isoform X1 [Calonectris borealis]|uniref:axonemal dynein light intermediate polypeptide 1 isoform X1 n=1 Tax=Calonectris borealis TaxID=1323832 RepID=UPI003F4B686B
MRPPHSVRSRRHGDNGRGRHDPAAGLAAAVQPAGARQPPHGEALPRGPPAEGDPAAARPRGPCPAAAPDGGRRRVREAAAGDPQRHPAAAVSGAGPTRAWQRLAGPAGRPVTPGASRGREWEEENQRWVQEVSSAPSSRLDVVHLQEQLDLRLQQRQARETGICPVRRELYSQCFDELIRETTINCAERGLLLLRVRDEIQMTIAAYQTLYESSVAFGMRKALQAEQGKSDMEKRIAELEEEKRELERQVNEEKAKCEAIEKRENEKRQIEEKKHTEEVQFLKRTNQQLKAQLESIVAPNK